jgi:hypothetical protein
MRETEKDAEEQGVGRRQMMEDTRRRRCKEGQEKRERERERCERFYSNSSGNGRIKSTC